MAQTADATTHIMKRIVLTGAESTGKSTLAKIVARHFHAPCSAEFVRQYVDDIQRNINLEDLDAIARGQIAVEDEVISQTQQLVFHDTNLLSSIIYAQHYFNARLEWVNECFAARDYTLYLLCIPDIPWQADKGQRESPQARDQLHLMFKSTLDELKLPYIEISGPPEQRLRQAIHAIEAV